jgi:nitrogen-specific signal transduction histidine kinase
MGLGLTLVQHIVHAHGGSVRVHSEVGKGSTFLVTLPIPDKGIPMVKTMPDGHGDTRNAVPDQSRVEMEV